jgi:hypothetical protein
MQLQERGIPLCVEEVEEAIHAELGWRLEALAKLQSLFAAAF